MSTDILVVGIGGQGVMTAAEALARAALAAGLEATKSGEYAYPEDPAGAMRAAGVDVAELDARGLAERLGDVRLANSVMLGAAAAYLPLPGETLREQVLSRFGHDQALARANAEAFEAGRELGA